MEMTENMWFWIIPWQEFSHWQHSMQKIFQNWDIVVPKMVYSCPNESGHSIDRSECLLVHPEFHFQWRVKHKQLKTDTVAAYTTDWRLLTFISTCNNNDNNGNNIMNSFNVPKLTIWQSPKRYKNKVDDHRKRPFFCVYRDHHITISITVAVRNR